MINYFQSKTIIFAVPIEVLRAFEGADLGKAVKTITDTKKKDK